MTSGSEPLENPVDTDGASTFDYAMPSLGADMEEGQIVEWQVAVGDVVARGDIVARVETEKSDIDIEIWHPGVVREFLVDLNRTVAVGTPILRLGAPSGGDAPQPQVEPPQVGPPPEVRTPEGRTTSEPAPTKVSAGLASPVARRLAHDRGVDLSDVVGTGPDGAIRRQDVEAYTARIAPDGIETAPSRGGVTVPAATPAPDRSARMRSWIAERMSRSNREIPHYYLERQVDLGVLVAWLSAQNESNPIEQRILPAAAFIRATAIAAARHHELNGTWVDDRFEPGAGVNVAVAISLRGGGLVTPYIEHADDSRLDGTMEKLREFTTAARSGSLRSEWTAGKSTITVTNLGDRGADLVHGVISSPEVALVGFGRIVERPWVVDGQVVIRPIVTVTLAADHRATDGALGSRFLSTLANALEHPEEL